MILDYNEAKKELFKKYNLEYTNNEEYWEKAKTIFKEIKNQ